MHPKLRSNRYKSSTIKNYEQIKPTATAWKWLTVAEKWLRPTQGLQSQKSKRVELNGWQADTSISKPRYFSKRKVTSVALGSLMLVSSMTQALHAGTITVTEPTIGGGSGCDLVEAIEAANNDSAGSGEDCTIGSGPDTILFNTSPDTINLMNAIISPNGNGNNGLPVITSTITISGGAGGITITRNSTTSFRILEVDGLGGSGGKLTLDNMTTHNGKASGNSGYSAQGGGVFIKNNAALTVKNSTIASNTAYHNGGGIYANTSTVTVDNSTISSNTALWGGGIHAGDNSAVTVDSSSIASNTASWGGGIHAYDNSPVTVVNSTIGSNIAYHSGGGIRAYNNTPVTVDNSTIIFNTAIDSGGGGIFARYSSSVTVDSSTIVSNTAYHSGGGIYADKSQVAVVSSTIVSNTTNESGGGIYADSSQVTVDNSTIASNKANDGGGIDADFSQVTVDSSTITSNTTTGSGGGINADSSPVTVMNSSLLKNTADAGGALYYNGDSSWTVNIQQSYIVGNSNAAIHNATGTLPDINAQFNWWGAANGPGGAFSGSGDTVSTFVDGANFLNAPISLDSPISEFKPTGLTLQEEPFWQKLFLPFISR